MKDENRKIEGDWNEIKGRLKEKYSTLTDDDLKYEIGKEEELFGRIEKRIGRSRDEFHGLIFRTGHM
ncbi:CsbD family protein [Belliella kenyensis]|uniref:CsbD family protein n=2 Tax=Belliella TaxID=232244 RepID=A0ABS9UVI4_9BACT|nr:MULTISPECIES: CsbD family protein [Belliella]MCH7400332.1 CsbD family protein [Belliella kenyensis]MCH7408187.1 CsbD family protein [Belliella filtrata]MDN3604650.1 CsbD family protein [Belliella kenyensis]